MLTMSSKRAKLGTEVDWLFIKNRNVENCPTELHVAWSNTKISREVPTAVTIFHE